jgi:hypothetical protein
MHRPITIISSSVMIVTTLAGVHLGCTDDRHLTGDETTLPAPTIVAAERVPEPAAGIYYLVSPGGGPEPVLVELLERELVPRHAWYPVQGTPCMAPTATDGLVVEMPAADDRLAELGFLAEPEPWLINCGVDSLWQYTFAP